MYHCFDDKLTKGRKNYWCYLCGKTIKKGKLHIVRSGIDCGQFHRSRMHIECEELTKKWDEMDWECHDVGEFNITKGDN